LNSVLELLQEYGVNTEGNIPDFTCVWSLQGGLSFSIALASGVLNRIWSFFHIKTDILPSICQMKCNRCTCLLSSDHQNFQLFLASSAFLSASSFKRRLSSLLACAAASFSAFLRSMISTALFICAFSNLLLYRQNS
jgi:hypothetical protein